MARKFGKAVGVVLQVNEGAVPASMLKEFQAAVQAGLVVMGTFWHKEVLPRHWEAGAAERYRYSARSRKYEKYKLKKQGHTRDLEWSGELRGKILNGAPQVEVKKSGLRMKFSGLPEHLYYRGRVTQGIVEGALAEVGGDVKVAAKLVGMGLRKVQGMVAEIQLIQRRRALVKKAFDQVGNVEQVAGMLGMSKMQVGSDLAALSHPEKWRGYVNKAREISEVTDDELARMKGLVAGRVKAHRFVKPGGRGVGVEEMARAA